MKTEQIKWKRNGYLTQMSDMTFVSAIHCQGVQMQSNV